VNGSRRTDEAQVRAALGRVLLGEAPPPPERFVGAAMSAGRRELVRRRAKLAAAGGVLGAAAVAVTAVALPALRDHGTDGRPPAGLSSLGAGDRQAALKQRAAGVLQDLLPWPGQRVTVLPHSIDAYQVTTSAGAFAITFRVDRPNSGVSAPVTTCDGAGGKANRARYLSCRAGTLPDGTNVAAMHQVDGEGGFHVTVGNPISTFRYRNADVMLALFGDDATMKPVPITDAQVLAVVTNPRFLELVEYWAAHPMGPRGATARATATAGGSAPGSGG
jgi:hypothetical protein